MTARRSLVLAAFAPELAGLDAAPPPAWDARCTGVGAITAAVETARLVRDLQPARVLFVGTCGAYDARLAVGELFEASEAIAASLDEREGRAYRPAIERTRWPATWRLGVAPPWPRHAVAVPPAVTTGAGAALGAVAPAEHLELTGVFAACHAAGVPVAAALAVANRVGPGAHAEWREHHQRASAALVAALRQARIF